MFNPEASSPVKQESIDISSAEFFPFLERLKKEIGGHEITCVLGDDKSARRPALIIGRAINKIYRAKGEDVVPQLFIDPQNLRIAQREHNPNIPPNETRYSELKRKAVEMITNADIKGGKVLIVTDFILSEQTIDILKEIIKEAGFEAIVTGNRFWYHNNDHGLIESDETDRITALPKIHNFDKDDIKSEAEKSINSLYDIADVEKAYNVFINSLIEINPDNIPDDLKPMVADMIQNPTKSSTRQSLYLSALIEKMCLTPEGVEEAKKLIESINKWSVKVFREDIDEISTQIANRFLESD